MIITAPLISKIAELRDAFDQTYTIPAQKSESVERLKTCSRFVCPEILMRSGSAKSRALQTTGMPHQSPARFRNS